MKKDERQAVAVLKTRILNSYETSAIARFAKRDREEKDFELTEKQRNWLLTLFAEKTQRRGKRL